MATCLTNKASVTNNQTLSLFRLSFNFLKSFSTSSPSANNASSTTTTSASKKPKRKKKKNLLEVAQFLPNWGIGYHMAKSHWTNVSYEITKINLYKDGRHGKAWGIAYKDGSIAVKLRETHLRYVIPLASLLLDKTNGCSGVPAADAPKKISGVHKRCWKYIPSLTKTVGSKPTSPKSTETETAPQAEVQAA